MDRQKALSEIFLPADNFNFQSSPKEKRSQEWTIMNIGLILYQKEKKATEFIIANKELLFQNREKEKRHEELLLANKELIFQNNEKEKRSIELQLLNFELKKAEAYQKEYIISLEKMVYMISHEVRQPIAHILGVSQLLQQAQSSKTFLKLLNYLKESVEALDKFTKDLTKFVGNLVQKEKNKK